MTSQKLDELTRENMMLKLAKAKREQDEAEQRQIERLERENAELRKIMPHP